MWALQQRSLLDSEAPADEDKATVRQNKLSSDQKIESNV